MSDHDAASNLGQFGARLRVRVEQTEVVDDDRDGKVERQHAEQGTDRADQHAEVRARAQVAVADRRHRHYRPPQTDRDRREAGAAAVWWADS